ncbi:CRAL-TRIO domain-containing protein [Haematococcus lacustris]
MLRLTPGRPGPIRHAPAPIYSVKVQSVKRLQATLTWRRDTKPELVVCRACLQDAKSHYMHLVGYDKQDRPIIYSCLALAKNKVYADNHDHMVQTFEMAIKCMGPKCSQWVWICDFHGFGMGDVNPKLAKAFLDISATHYPERLGLFMVVDAPSLFTLLWNAISSWVDPKTHQKIKFLPYDATSSKSKLVTAMAEVVDPVTLGWLQREMAENRDKATAKTKAYDMSSMHRCASSGQLLTTPRGDSGHDHRGSPALLSAYASSPTLLEPQATSKLE